MVASTWPFVDVIADVHQPLRHIAVDPRIDRRFVPGRGLPGQHQILADRVAGCAITTSTGGGAE